MCIGEAKVIEVQQVRVFDLDPSQIDGYEAYESQEQLLSVLRRYYGNFVSLDTPAKIIHFIFSMYETPRSFVAKQLSSDKVSISSKVKLYADGGSRGNPGPSALGFVVVDPSSSEVVFEFGKYIGITTNNQAEYQALVRGMEYCRAHGIREIEVYMDSLLVINQMKGIFKVRNRDLWSLYEKAKEFASSFNSITFQHVPRELNKLADIQVNIALDSVKGADAVQ
jgi:ribonuclease HI